MDRPHRFDRGRRWLRLAFIAVYPTLPFWDSRALVHFASLIRQHGLAAEGWYWAQFNSGLPMILAALFRFAPGDPIPVARTATAVATGLVGVIPFVLWRPALAFRWRLLAGALLALWPGQIFFSGVVAQDNWVLLPVIGLASLAARRLLEQGRGHPVAGGLLYAAAIAIRQEMMIVLLPVVLAASVDWNEARRFRRDLSRLGIIVFLCLLALGTQRFLATGRASLTTEHGALGLFGSFMPGASEPGWIDARAYATAVDPQAPPALFGNQRTLLRMTWEEVKRRPGFHFARIAAWFPRLALNSDADNLLWSVGAPQSQADGRQADAQAFQRRWAPRLRWELGIIQGLFVITVLIGLQRRNAAILILSSAVLLKFMVHMVVSPLGRLLVPAVALELLTIPLGVRALASGSLRIRVAAIAGTAATCLLLVLGVPSLADFVVRHDSPVLQGIRRFNLRVDDEGVAQCELGPGSAHGHRATLGEFANGTGGARSGGCRADRLRDPCPGPRRNAGPQCPGSLRARGHGRSTNGADPGGRARSLTTPDDRRRRAGQAEHRQQGSRRPTSLGGLDRDPRQLRQGCRNPRPRCLATLRIRSNGGRQPARNDLAAPTGIEPVLRP